MLRRLILSTLLLFSPLSAASVIYHLVDGDAVFQYTAADFITSALTVPAANLDFCTVPGAACVEIRFTPNSGTDQRDRLTWVTAVPGFPGNTTGGFTFGVGTFAVPGVHVDTIGGGPLTITVVPEPGYLPIAGLGLMVIAWRRRLRRG